MSDQDITETKKILDSQVPPADWPNPECYTQDEISADCERAAQAAYHDMEMKALSARVAPRFWAELARIKKKKEKAKEPVI